MKNSLIETTFSKRSKSINSIFNRLNMNPERMMKRLDRNEDCLKSSDEISKEQELRREKSRQKLRKRINFQQFKAISNQTLKSFLPKLSPYIKSPEQILRLSRDNYYIRDDDDDYNQDNYKPRYYQVNNLETIKIKDIFAQKYINNTQPKVKHKKTGSNYMKFSPIKKENTNSRKKIKLGDLIDHRTYYPKYEIIDKHVPSVIIGAGTERFNGMVTSYTSGNFTTPKKIKVRRIFSK